MGLNGCAGQGRLGGKVFDLILVNGYRAYNFTMEGDVNRDFLLAMLATVKFDPLRPNRPSDVREARRPHSYASGHHP